MGNPKYIKTPKKVTYSFRVDEDKLEKLKRICEIEGMKLPQLMSEILDSYLWNKTVYNTYLEDTKGMFISLPDITQGVNVEYGVFNSTLTLEYEVKQIPNNLDYWSHVSLSYQSNSKDSLHEGIEFLIVPELSEYEGRCFTDLNEYLYCIRFIQRNDLSIDIKYISFMEAINLIRNCENYPLLNHALKLKETLEERTEQIRSQIYGMAHRGEEYNEFEYVWTELRQIAQEFNSGNVIPINESIKDIEYKASLQSMSEFDKDNILKENDDLKKKLNSMQLTLEELRNTQKQLEKLVIGDLSEEELESLKKSL